MDSREKFAATILAAEIYKALVLEDFKNPRHSFDRLAQRAYAAAYIFCHTRDAYLHGLKDHGLNDHYFADPKIKDDPGDKIQETEGKVSDEMEIILNLLCPICGEYMSIETDENGKCLLPTHFSCKNSDCEWYGKRFKSPTLKIYEVADPGVPDPGGEVQEIR